MPDIAWQRSSFCGGGGNNCIEIRLETGLTQIRESAAPGSVVTTTSGRLAGLITGVKEDRLGHSN
ncbi:DUF397 domain-containing protein [Streptomyces gamaensis]|uniref:DUF397 domain-containing protein n=1 Tax=Streptomyces gamaensis TaxID=1763542 RepID=A0ABW0Z475_9ACTN